VLIVETPVFTNRVLDILTDDEYRELQHFLAQYPDAGDMIPGSHGLRKLRWTISGKGKRGGTRIIYYWLRPRNVGEKVGSALLVSEFCSFSEHDYSRVGFSPTSQGTRY